MEIKDMILVTENWKGTEINFLLSFEDYRKSVLPAFEDTTSVVIEAVVDLCESWRNQEHWAEIYYSANKSVSARYCAGEEQLRMFMNGYFNSSDQEWRFDTDRCSADCLNVLQRYDIGANGVASGIEYSYEKASTSFGQGDLLHNFNGTDYRVLEKLSERNLLLLSEGNGDFIVAIGVNLYKRHPKSEIESVSNTSYGIEWEHGIYCGPTPSAIDFKELRTSYGEYKEVTPAQEVQKEMEEYQVFQIEIREILSRVQTIEAETLGDAIDKAMGLYDSQQVVLDYSDCKGVDYIHIDSEKTR